MNARKLLSAAKAVEAAYIEDVFSTYLYTGNGSTQTITNGIDLAGKGGLVWIKMRSVAGYEHILTDTARGAQLFLSSDNTLAQQTGTNDLTAFTSTGFSLGSSSRVNRSVASENQFASWTFRKQAKFFDVVTYTGDGAISRQISHNLGSVPGMIVVKSTTTAGTNWIVFHRSSVGNIGFLSSTDAFQATPWISSPTATDFSITGEPQVNKNGDTFVAYLFAHDAGGFGASGSDNVISCGSYSGSSAAQTITLGYEPQWIIIKRASGGTGSWYIWDTMRGMVVGGNDPALAADSSLDETGVGTFNAICPTATGFTLETGGASYPGWNNTGSTYIYIAIRRGPMKTPTTGTSVYNAIARTGTGAAATVSGVGFAPDYLLHKPRPGGTDGFAWDRLRGPTQYIRPNLTNAEGTSSAGFDLISFNMDGISCGPNSATGLNVNTVTEIDYFFRRAPGFFDVVCYTGTGVNNRDISHNLGVSPELVIVKSRSLTQGWIVANSLTGYGNYMQLQSTNASGGASYIQSVTATTFRVDDTAPVNSNSNTYVAYLFATCLGVSKVGSYTGTGNTLQIDCGFTGGARFVLIKRTDSAGDWYVWDSARGIVAGNDPYLLLNSTAAEVTTTDWVDTHSPGFELSSAVGNNANISTASYIFLAIA